VLGSELTMARFGQHPLPQPDIARELDAMKLCESVSFEM
jgi:hypothetical protein